MTGLILRRLAAAVPLLLGVGTILFIVLHLAPGDPASLLVDPSETDASSAALLRERLGLAAPLPVQLVRWLGALARGDLGQSIAQARPVSQVLADALPETLLLASVSLVLLFALGLAIGLVAAAREGSLTDHVASLVSLTLYSVPSFWLALVLLLIFSDALRIFPSSQSVSLDHDLLSGAGRALDTARHLALPAIALALGGAGGVARHARAGLIEAKRSDHARTARAKGISETRILITHALRNALLPIVTLVGLYLPGLFGGAVLVETIFARPGLGRVLVTAILQRDYPVVLGASFFFALLVVVGSLVADVLYAAVDPRVREA